MGCESFDVGSIAANKSIKASWSRFARCDTWSDFYCLGHGTREVSNKEVLKWHDEMQFMRK